MKGDPTSLLERIQLNRNQYVRYHMDQELEADSCSARLLGHAYVDPRHLADSLSAFIADLEPDKAPAKLVPAVATTGPVPADPTAAKVAKVGTIAVVAEDIVTTPSDQHPSSVDRARNLETMYQEVRAEVALLLATREHGP